MEAAVIAALEGSDRPMTAYAVQDLAAAQGIQLYPTQVYRTLRRLVDRGEVARIESINSFVLTSGPADAIAICDQCKRAIPVAAQAPTRAIADLIGETGFSVTHLIIEAHGRCGRCARGILE